jgi:hypothetical protein
MLAERFLAWRVLADNLAHRVIATCPPRGAALNHQTPHAIGPDPHLERVLLHLDPLDQELDDPRLLGWKSSYHSLGMLASAGVGKKGCDGIEQ